MHCTAPSRRGQLLYLLRLIDSAAIRHGLSFNSHNMHLLESSRKDSLAHKPTPHASLPKLKWIPVTLPLTILCFATCKQLSNGATDISHIRSATSQSRSQVTQLDTSCSPASNFTLNDQNTPSCLAILEWTEGHSLGRYLETPQLLK